MKQGWRDMRARTLTFDLGTDIDGLDELEVEKAWNSWTGALVAEGLRPADIPTRSTATSATFRLFELGHYEELEHAVLDFDISKLGVLAASGVGIFTMAMGLGYWRYILGILGGPECLA